MHSVWLNMYSLSNDRSIRACYFQRVTHNRSHIVTRCLVKTVSQANVFTTIKPNSEMLTRVDRHLSSKSTVWISEPKHNVKMHFVVKTDRPDPERGITVKWDIITLKKFVPKKKAPDIWGSTVHVCLSFYWSQEI